MRTFSFLNDKKSYCWLVLSVWFATFAQAQTPAFTATTTPVCGTANGTITLTLTTALSKIRYVRLEQNNMQAIWINLAEIRVLEAFTGINVALDKTVTSQSLYSPPYPNAHFVDGNIATFGHSGSDGNQYVEVDLGAEYLIDNIEIINRADAWQTRAQNLQLILKSGNGTAVHSRSIDAYQNQNNGFTSNWNVTDISWADGANRLNRTGLNAGSYTLTYRDITGANYTLPIVVDNTNVIPTVSVAITNGLQTICAGTNVTFTATATNGGTTPIYRWEKNGSPVGTNQVTYSDAALADGDEITCALTSDVCSATPTVTASSIVMTVQQAPWVSDIEGDATIGVHADLPLTNPTAGGIWSSSNPAIATVQANGVVTGIAVGTATITYTVTSNCGTTAVTKEISVVNNTTYCLHYRPIREGNYLYLQLTLLADGGSFNLGSANLQFKYKNTVLTNPTLMSTPLTATGNYAGITFTTPNVVGMAADDKLGSFNFNFTGATGDGLNVPVTGAGTMVAVIRFNIASDANTPNFRTYENGTRGTVVYNDVPTFMPKGTCFDYDYPITTSIQYSAASFCASEVPQTIQFIGNVGGSYNSDSGLHLNSITGEIIPALSTAGTYVVSYNIPASNGGRAQTTVTIHPTPATSITGLMHAYCSSIAPFALTGIPVGGSFTIDGVASTTLNPSALTAGAHNISYTYTNNFVCTNQVEKQVMINEAPRLVNGFNELNICVGDPIHLNASITGTNLTYTWRKDNVVINGATTSSYDLANTTANSNGIYELSVDGCSNTTLTTSAVVTLHAAPSITTQPAPTTEICTGSLLELSVEAVGVGLTYQWKKNGVDIPLANYETFRIENTRTTDAGIYTVTVGSYCAPAVTSASATVLLQTSPTITTQPIQQTLVCAGTALQIGVTATGNGLTYQWKKEGIAIANANAAVYTVPNVATNDAGTYTVEVIGNCGTAVLSTDAFVFVNEVTSITDHPAASTTLCAGTSLELSVNATGSQLSYQWTKNGMDISGATTSFYFIGTTASNDGGFYQVRITGICGTSVLSNPAIVSIDIEPSILVQAATNSTVCIGSSLNLGVVTAGGGLTYQWQKDGVDIPNATLPTYQMAWFSASDIGIYKVRISGSCGTSILSDGTTVTMAVSPSAITGAEIVRVGLTTPFTNAVPGGTWSSEHTAIATVDASGVVTGITPGVTTIRYNLNNSCNLVTKSITVLANKVVVNLKVFLEGASGAAGLMSDDLRTNALLPSSEPYTNLTGFLHQGGTETHQTVSSAILNVSGNNAIVDWVFVELRSKTLASTVLYTRSGLLQRDGDIVDVDGISPLSFESIQAEEYYIAVRHRNHLGFRTATAMALNHLPTVLDLSNGSQTTFGIEALKIVNGTYVMYVGEANGDGVINAVDLNNVWLLQNGTNGYLRSDFDLNGVVNAIDRNAFWRLNNSRIEQLD